ncbi:MAG: F0F1 ATP synthase subunit delta [Patescibacteria group bacterium]
MTSYPSSFYAKAFRRALQEKRTSTDELVKNFVVLLKKDVAARNRDDIIKGVSREVVRGNGGHWITIETARTLPKTPRERIRRLFSHKDFIEERIRPDLVAGIRIVVDGEKEFDGSLKRKLNKLFS